MKRVRALILDDSAICRRQLHDILEAEGDIEIVGEAASGDQVLELIVRTSPGILLVDLQMPGTGGHETIEQVMAHHPLPILVVTGQPQDRRGDTVFESIRRGALDLAEKPAPSDERAHARLRAMVRMLASVPVVRHVAGNLGRRLDPESLRQIATSAPPAGSETGVPVIGIGASAGGPTPLAQVLAGLPRGFPAAIAVVQHLPPGFSPSFAEFLRARTPLNVTIPAGRCKIVAGSVYLAPDGAHLVAEDRGHLGCSLASPIEGHRPAASALFESLAKICGARSAGVVLSGMGRDGVSGLASMRLTGALTLAQDRDSSAVFGMPRAALEAGAAQAATDPPGLVRALMRWIESQTRGRSEA
jgi:two-component system, chemotaxis family, protein-glutamate methylesterase/glutaminase